MNYKKEELVKALVIAGLPDSPTFKDYASNYGALEKGDPQFAFRRTEYNEARSMVEHAIRHFTEGGKGKASIAYNPAKGHKGRLAAGVRVDSVLYHALEDIRRDRTKVFLHVMQLEGDARMTCEESGLSAKAFGELAKSQNCIPRDFANITDSGNYSYPWEKQQEWMAWRDKDILEARSLEVAANPSPAKAEKPAKQKKEKQAA